MGLAAGSDGSYPYTTYEGSDFSRNIAIPDIDFGTFHLYTTDCKAPLICYFSLLALVAAPYHSASI
jgi:hypothetical protein